MSSLLGYLADGLYHSGESISREMGVTRAAVWKQVEALRERGLTIESAGKRGYRLIMPDDPLFPPLFAADGHPVEYNYSIPSSNARAAELARSGAKEGAIVLAEIQTGGRGRRERAWASPMGGLWFSVMLRPTMPPISAQRIPLVAAVAVAEAIEAVAGIRPDVKWPNDILINSKKVCGILLEMSVEAERVAWLVTGVGINVAQSIEDFPEELRDTATSLSLATGKPIRRGDILRAFAERFSYWYNALEEGSDPFYYDIFMPAYGKLSLTLGRRVAVIADSETYDAQAESIGGSGELIVRMDDGARRSVWAADVSVRLNKDA